MKTKKTVTLLLICALMFFALAQTREINECVREALTLCVESLVPSLFPFFVISGLLVNLGFVELFGKILSPVARVLFKTSGSGAVVFVIGIICGYPTGAKVIANMYKDNKLKKEEAERLLAFCNNIGPVYFISYALPVIGITTSPVAFLFGMYGLPFLYGLFLRYTLFSRSIPFTKNSLQKNKMSADTLPFLAALDESVTSALLSIARLGGYMIFFNLLNIIPAQYLPMQFQDFISCILEISGGLQFLQNKSPVFALCALSFGGLSCLAQTYSMVHESGLSIKNYLSHKAILTAFSLFYYVVLASKPF